MRPRGVERWNRDHRQARAFRSRLKVPHKAFHRRIGPLAAANVDPGRQRRVGGRVGSAVPTAGCRARADRAFVASLMGRVVEPGKFANWIAPPARGINNQPVDFEYVRFN